jgi:hypothetical protein
LHVRHIQNDTLLYLVLPAALRAGNYDVAGEVRRNHHLTAADCC